MLTKAKLKKIKKGISVPLSNPRNLDRSIPLSEHGPGQPGTRQRSKLEFVSRDMLPVLQVLDEILLEVKKISDKLK